MHIVLGIIGSAVAGLALVIVVVVSMLIPLQMIGVQFNGCLSATSCTTPVSSVDAWATTIASHLTVCGTPATDACYDASMPAAVLAEWQRECPQGSGCWADWQNGQVQCVLLVTAAYALAGIPLPRTGNAIDFWTLYQQLPNWSEIPDGTGLPTPGDMLIWSSVDPITHQPGNGHIAVVTAVTSPTIDPGAQKHLDGSVTFAEANGPAPFVTEQLAPDGHLLSWGGYSFLGYIRFTGTSHLQVSGVQAFICAVVPYVHTAQIAMSQQGVTPPWLTSVIIAQWGLEQGWKLPGYTGDNFGNVAALPGYPTIGGTSAPGSPPAFAYAYTPQQGVDEYVTVVKNGLYTTVTTAGAQGADAQATALGVSPWDAAHYTADGHPGDSLTAIIQHNNLTRYDAGTIPAC